MPHPEKGPRPPEERFASATALKEALSAACLPDAGSHVASSVVESVAGSKVSADETSGDSKLPAEHYAKASDLMSWLGQDQKAARSQLAAANRISRRGRQEPSPRPQEEQNENGKAATIPKVQRSQVAECKHEQKLAVTHQVQQGTLQQHQVMHLTQAASCTPRFKQVPQPETVRPGAGCYIEPTTLRLPLRRPCVPSMTQPMGSAPEADPQSGLRCVAGSPTWMGSQSQFVGRHDYSPTPNGLQSPKDALFKSPVRSPVRQQSSPATVAFTVSPASTTCLNGPSSPMPGSCSPLPQPGWCSPMPGPVSPMLPSPGSCSPLPGSCSPMLNRPGSSSPMPGSGSPMPPGSCRPMPGSCSPLHGLLYSPRPGALCSPRPGTLCSPRPGAPCSTVQSFVPGDPPRASSLPRAHAVVPRPQSVPHERPVSNLPRFETAEHRTGAGSSQAMALWPSLQGHTPSFTPGRFTCSTPRRLVEGACKPSPASSTCNIMELRSNLQTAPEPALSPPRSDGFPSFAAEPPCFVTEACAVTNAVGTDAAGTDATGTEPGSCLAESAETEPLSPSLHESSADIFLPSSLVIADSPKAPEDDPSDREDALEDSDPGFTASTAAESLLPDDPKPTASLPDSAPRDVQPDLEVENDSSPAVPSSGQLNNGFDETWQHLHDQLQSLHQSVNDFAQKQPGSAPAVLGVTSQHSQRWGRCSPEGPTWSPSEGAVPGAKGAKAAAQLLEADSQEVPSFMVTLTSPLPPSPAESSNVQAMHMSHMSRPNGASHVSPGFTPSSTSRDSAPSYSCFTQASYPANSTASYQPSSCRSDAYPSYPTARELRSQAIPFAMHSFERTDAMLRLRRALGEQKRSSSQPGSRSVTKASRQLCPGGPGSRRNF